MSTPANVIKFYAEARWGTGYGVIDAAHKYPGHKGLDVALFHGVVQVPALHDGTVVAVVKNPNVGHYVQVRRADGLFDTYCHIAEIEVSVTEKVTQGTNLGRQAMTQAEGGAQWEGQHTHLTLSKTMAGWGTWGANNLNPTPGVIAVLTNTAGSAGQPIDNTKPKSKEYDMDHLYWERTTGPENKTQWMLIGLEFDDGALVTQDVKVANGWFANASNAGGVLTDEQWQPTLDTAKIASDAWKAAQGSNGGGAPADETGVIAAIEALGTLLGGKLDGLPAEIDRYADGKKQSS